MGGFALDDPIEPFGYACPWCPVVVVDAGLVPAVTVFEGHLDGHMAAGDHQGSAA